MTRLNLASDTAATSKGEKQFFQPKSASEYAKLPRKDFNPPTGEHDDYYKANALNITLENYFEFGIPNEEEKWLLMFSAWEGVELVVSAPVDLI